MTRLPIYTEIAGVEGREPIGAVLTIGTRKSATSAPTDRDRFYFKLPRVDSSKTRPDHPSFAPYNAAPPERRKVINAVVVHATLAGWCTSSLIHYSQKGDPTPNARPWCIGDGARATRWDRKSSEYRDIPCPNERCEYRLGTSAACKPILRVLLQPTWPASADGRSLPSPLTELDSHSWHSTSNMVGMIRHVQEQARQLGIEDGAWSWYGFPFAIQLTEQTSREKQSRFPVLRFSPSVGVQDFLLSQASRRDQLAAAYDRPRAALTAPETVIDVAEVVAGLAGPRGDG